MNNFLFGLLITAVSQVSEVVDISSAVAFMPTNHYQVTEYLDEIDNRVTPIVVINTMYQDQSGRFVYNDGLLLKQALAESKHFSRIIFMWDEPLHNGILAGQSRDEVLDIMSKVKLDFPGVEFAHIEAFTDLFYQYMTQQGNLKLFYEADHIGFDCYGNFDGCGGFGVPEIHQMTYMNVIYHQIKKNKSNAKIFMVPGAFINDLYMTDEQQVIEQLYDYANAYQNNHPHVSGFGVFTWGDVVAPGDYSIGARNLQNVKKSVENVMNWFKNPSQYVLSK